MQFLANLRRNSGLQSDPEWRKFVTRWSLASLLLIVVACWFSYGFYQFDEYYEVTEFVGYKLGKTPSADLVWEFHYQLRPWLQPAIEYVAAKGLIGLGIHNPASLTLAFRAINGICGWAAITALMLAAGVLFPDNRRRRPAVIVLALLWLIPYFAVRTSEESLGGDFLALGLAAVLLGSTAADDDARGSRSAGLMLPVSQRRIFPVSTGVVAGLCFGLAFEFRFHTAIAIASIMAWMLCYSGESWRPTLRKLAVMCSAVAVPLALGLVADRWGYSNWTFAPWNYFYQLLVLGRHNEFGVQPPWWYFTNLFSQPAAPMLVLWAVAMVVTWVRFPRHLLTWATLPFCFIHSAIGHKELRFLFPIMLPATLAFIMAYAPAPGEVTQAAWLRAIWDRRRGWIAYAIYGLNFLFLAANCLSNKQPNVAIQQLIYDRYPQGVRIFIVGPDSSNPYDYPKIGQMFFYRPPKLTIRRVNDYEQLAVALRAERGPALVLSDHLSEAPEQAAAAPQAHLIYRTYPSWVERYNYFHWLERSKHYSLYAVDEQRPDETVPIARAITPKQSEPPQTPSEISR